MCVGDLSNGVGSAHIHAGLSKSMWGGRGPGAGRFVRGLGPLSLCVGLLVHANRNDTSDRGLGPLVQNPGPRGQQRSARSPGWDVFRARRDPSNAVGRAEIHAGLSKSMWRPRADRGPGAGRFVRGLGPLPLCVVLLAQANVNHTSVRGLGPAAESTL